MSDSYDNISFIILLSFFFVCNQVFQVDLQDDGYLLKSIQVGLNPIAGISVNHAEALVKLLCQPCLRDTFLCQDGFYPI